MASNAALESTWIAQEEVSSVGFGSSPLPCQFRVARLEILYILYSVSGFQYELLEMIVTGQRVRESHVWKKIERYLKRERERETSKCYSRKGDAVNIYKGEFYLLRICQRQV